MVTVGIGLLLLGAALLVAEAHLPAYGALGVAGLVALVTGGALAVEGSGGGLALVLAVSMVLAATAGSFLVIAARQAAAVSRRRARTGAEGLVGHVGVVRSVPAPVGFVFVDGALWRARPCWDDGQALGEGDRVVVERVHGLTLSVRRAEEWELEP